MAGATVTTAGATATATGAIITAGATATITTITGTTAGKAFALLRIGSARSGGKPPSRPAGAG
ncbi:hypothetical protein MOX02_13040 [Methylobacterium oxalidis]|uniref:Uncharacterized protein n=1 Tax=Methylobacterium oxalidis TaxID=944322 RepID=A0A512IZY4_9HYPH|nr:hypothetical protein MOX02_13040 [Methylobacterium oxalidis]GLS64228.1 hypothetical protein GCM10007888_26090 [Methylobacterium oxalidis]